MQDDVTVEHLTRERFVVTDDSSDKTMTLSETDMEWFLNSLRLMQESQQKLAAENHGKELSAEDVANSLNANPDAGKGREWIPTDPEAKFNVGEMFAEQFNEVTELRERIVEFVGHDLTDG